MCKLYSYCPIFKHTVFQMAYCIKRLQHWATHMLILGLGLKQQKNHELQGLAPEKKGGLHYGGKKKSHNYKRAQIIVHNV